MITAAISRIGPAMPSLMNANTTGDTASTPSFPTTVKLGERVSLRLF